MLKKKITYTDFDGNERTEEFYFNLTKAEISEMELTTEGGLSSKLKRISASKDVPELYSTFKSIILKAYGIKSDDGRRFIKNDKLSEEFTQTAAYDELMMSFLNGENEASDFINSLLPQDLPRDLAK